LALYSLACKTRVESEEAVFHVMDRGDRREAIFGDFFLVTKLSFVTQLSPKAVLRSSAPHTRLAMQGASRHFNPLDVVRADNQRNDCFTIQIKGGT
jgi:hypothetical protein